MREAAERRTAVHAEMPCAARVAMMTLPMLRYTLLVLLADLRAAADYAFSDTFIAALPARRR